MKTCLVDTTIERMEWKIGRLWTITTKTFKDITPVPKKTEKITGYFKNGWAFEVSSKEMISVFLHVHSPSHTCLATHL